MPLALVLDELAARLSGDDPSVAREDPTRWAYAIREAVALAKPDTIVVGWGGEAETAALRSVADGATGDDLVDALYDAPPLREVEPASTLPALVGTLRDLFPGGPSIAVALRGPSSVAAALAADGDDVDEIADTAADALADLAGAVAEAGAAALLVVEDLVAPSADAHKPLVRVLSHHSLDGVLVATAAGDADLSAVGYPRVATAWAPSDADAPDVALVDPALWEDPDEAGFAAADDALRAAASSGALVLTGGPLPGSLALERLQRA